MSMKTKGLVALAAMSIVGSVMVGTTANASVDQTMEEVQAILDNNMLNIIGTNDMTSEDIQLSAEAGLEYSSYILNQESFNLTEATTQEAGSIQTSFSISKDATTSQAVEYSIPIAQLESKLQTLSELTTQVENAIPTLKVDNSTDTTDILNQLESTTGNNTDLTIRLDNFVNTNSTTTQAGAIVGVLVITDSLSGEESSIDLSLSIDKLQSNDISIIVDNLNILVDGMSFDNMTDIESVKKIIDSSSINPLISISASNLIILPATETTTGSATFVVTFTDTTGSEVTTLETTFNKDIPKLVISKDETFKETINRLMATLVGDSQSNEVELSNYVKEAIEKEIGDATISVGIYNLEVIEPATTTNTGTANLVVELIGLDGYVLDVNTNLSIAKIDNAEEDSLILEQVVNAAKETIVAKDYTPSSISSSIKAKMQNQDLDVNVSNIQVYSESTVNELGVLDCLVTVIKSDGTEVSVVVPIKVEMLSGNQDLSDVELQAKVVTILGTLDFDNGVTKEYLEENITAGLADNGIGIQVSNLNIITLSTDNSYGVLECNIVMIKADGTKVILEGVQAEIRNYTEDAPITNMTDEQVKVAVTDRLSMLSGYGGTSAGGIKEEIDSTLEGQDIVVVVSDLLMTQATEIEEGRVDFKVTLTRSTGEVITMNSFIKINKLEVNAETIDRIIDKMLAATDEVNMTNDTTKKDLEDSIKNTSANPLITVSISEFKVTPATKTEDGYIDFSITAIEKNSAGLVLNQMSLSLSRDLDKLIDVVIDPIDTTTGILTNDQTKLKEFYSSYKSSNESTIDKALDVSRSKLEDSKSVLRIVNYSLVKADYIDEGSCTFTAVLELNGESIEVDYDYAIPKLVKSSSSSGSSSKSNSSGSNSNTTSTTTSTTTKATEEVKASPIKDILKASGVTVIDKNSLATAVASMGLNKPVDATIAKEIAQEVSKVVTENVVSNLSTTLGEGVVADVAKEITLADNTKITVSAVSKDGKQVGAVITSDKASAATTIPTEGTVKAVYKFIPLLGRYIELTAGVVIGETSITLPTETNAVYYAATEKLTANDTIVEGWAKVGNDWYVVSALGEPKTGWQQDSTGWAYLSEDKGTMQTGWTQQGDNWYHLAENGYMTTGWVKSSDNWYYMNSNGAMAVNTVIDGYSIDSTGRWI